MGNADMQRRPKHKACGRLRHKGLVTCAERELVQVVDAGRCAFTSTNQMRASRIDTAYADHRRTVNLVSIPKLTSLTSLIHHAEGAHRLFPLLTVDAGLGHEIRDVSRGIFKIVGMLLIDDAFKKRHGKLIDKTKGFEREVGLREGLEFLLPGNRAHADGHVLGRGLGPFFKMRRKLQAVRAGIGEKEHNFNLVSTGGSRRCNYQIFLSGSKALSGKKLARERERCCAQHKLTTSNHGGMFPF